MPLRQKRATTTRIPKDTTTRGWVPSAPIANFSGTPLSGAYNLPVQFTDLSQGGIVSWAWTFGDTGTSIEQNPLHTYLSDGSWTVSLTVTNALGTDTETKVAYVTTTVPVALPVANFSRTPTSGTAPLTVQFTDLTTGSPNTWSWNFGDGATSVTQSPSHIYTTAGTYNVTLIATNSRGSSTYTMSSCVTVTLLVVIPVANFSATPLSGNFPLAVQFTDLSTNTPTSWLWNFGDGVTSTSRNPSHTYASAGSYTVTLYATNSAGTSPVHSVSNYIVVTTPVSVPVTNFSASPLTGVSPLYIQFTDLTAGSPTSWSWNFGDGVTSTLQNPSHTYTSSNNASYTIVLVATNTAGSNTLTRASYISITTSEGNAVFYIFGGQVCT